jgi:hypothetical protein
MIIILVKLDLILDYVLSFSLGCDYVDWSSKQSWEKEDLLYSAKRKVNNTGSRSHLHIIGSIFSRKMNRSIAYESLWGECLFYYFLELDPLTIRYYEQPVLVPYKILNEKYVLEEINHVPDVLGFRQGSVPHLPDQRKFK